MKPILTETRRSLHNTSAMGDVFIQNRDHFGGKPPCPVLKHSPWHLYTPRTRRLRLNRFPHHPRVRLCALFPIGNRLFQPDILLEDQVQPSDGAHSTSTLWWYWEALEARSCIRGWYKGGYCGACWRRDTPSSPSVACFLSWAISEKALHIIFLCSLLGRGGKEWTFGAGGDDVLDLLLLLMALWVGKCQCECGHRQQQFSHFAFLNRLLHRVHVYLPCSRDNTNTYRRIDKNGIDFTIHAYPVA